MGQRQGYAPLEHLLWSDKIESDTLLSLFVRGPTQLRRVCVLRLQKMFARLGISL